MPRKRTGEATIATAERDRRIIELRRSGWQWRDIAEDAGISMTRCHQVFTEYQRDIPASVMADWRNEELDLLGRGIQDLLRRLRDHGDMADRTAGELWRQIMLLSESRRKMMGIDAPVKREIEMIDSTPGDAQLQREIAAWESEEAAIQKAKDHHAS